MSAQQPPQSLNIEQLSKSIVAIIDVYNGGTILRGTGTIVQSESRYFVVTATHVINDCKGAIQMGIAGDDLKPVIIELSKLTKNSPKSWKYHSTADIAIIEIFPIDTLTKNRCTNAFPVAKINNSKESIQRDTDLTVFGYPIVDNQLQNFEPLSFKYHFASRLITLPRADTKQPGLFQMIQNPSIQGVSGGPVFIGAMRGGVSVGPSETYLVGFMHGTFSDNTGGKLGMVTPSFYLFEIK